MTDLTHAQARQYLLAAADGLLGEPEQTELALHLQTCQACRAESARLDTLYADLRRTFRSRWEHVPPPQPRRVAQQVRAAQPQYQGMPARLARTAVNVVLIIVWLWLYRAVFAYLQVIFSHEEFRTNQILLMGVVVLFFIQVRKTSLRPRLDALPQISPAALALALGGSAVYLVAERYLDINTLSASLFGLATYGLLGLWLSPRRWREGLPAALLLIGTLPFGDHLETFVGYPMRIATASIVRDGLQALGIHSVGTDSILVFESGLAQVDLPCSGVKSLWTGMLFLTAATWLERKPIHLRWIGTALLAALLLFGMNVARVGTLVVVGQAAGWSLAAEIIHVPLGVLGFGLVCGVTVLLLRGMPSSKSSTDRRQAGPSGEIPQGEARPLWLAPLLALLIAGMALLYTPRPQSVVAQESLVWSFPKGINIEASPLSPALFKWATEGGAESADRWNFGWQGGQVYDGSILFLTSHTWRGQHRPERCFEVQGMMVDGSQTILLAPDFPARLLTLSGGPVKVSAVYWLQTGNTVTDDFAKRIWADLNPQRQRWVLVTVLFNTEISPDDPDLPAFLRLVRQTAAQGLDGVK